MSRRERHHADRLTADIVGWLDDPEPAMIAATVAAWDEAAWHNAQHVLLTQGVGPYLLDRVRDVDAEGLFAPDLRAWLRREYAANARRMEVMHDELATILAGANRLGIAVLPLKGSVLSVRHYTTPALRPMADLDLLVRPSEELALAEVLTDLGLRLVPGAERDHRTYLDPEQRVVSTELDHPDNPRPVEVHTQLRRVLWQGRDSPDLAEYLWRESRELEHLGQRAWVTSDAALLADLAQHAMRHALLRTGRVLQWLDLAHVAAGLDGPVAPAADWAYPSLRLAARAFPSRFAGFPLEALAVHTAPRLRHLADTVPLNSRAGLNVAAINAARLPPLARRWVWWKPTAWRVIFAFPALPRPLAYPAYCGVVLARLARRIAGGHAPNGAVAAPSRMAAQPIPLVATSSERSERERLGAPSRWAAQAVPLVATSSGRSADGLAAPAPGGTAPGTASVPAADGWPTRAVRVVLVNYAYDPSLVSPEALLERYETLTGWAEGLLRAGLEVGVVQRFSADARIECQGASYRFVRDDLAPMLRSWQVSHRVQRQVMALEPDVVHVNGFGFPLALRALRASLPPSAVMVAQHHGESPRPGLGGVLQRWGLASADGLLFAADGLAQPWQGRGIGPRGRAFEVMEGSTHFVPRPKASARARTGMHGRPVFLWVGNLDGNKDPLTVLEGFAGLLEVAPGARLYMAYGKTDQLAAVRARLDREARLARAVTLMGRIPHDELVWHYSSADYFVLGSHHEGSGYALAEALCCGVVPIVTDIPSFRMMTDDGRIGVLWKPGEAEGFHRAAVAVLALSREDHARAAREHFEAQLSFAAIGRQASEVYRTVSDRTVSDRTVSDRTVSHRTVSHRTAIDQTGIDRTGIDQTGIDQTGSDRTGIDHTGIDGTVADPDTP